MRTIGIFEAKAQLSQLIQAMEAGEDVVLTRHGKPVARLVPPAAHGVSQSVQDWASELRSYRHGRDHGITQETSLQELIDAGRR